MAVAARIRPADLFTPQEWAPLSARSRWMGLWLVVHCWGTIALAAAMAVVWPVTIPLAVMIIGARQLGLAILMHDAAHGCLHPDQAVNDWVGENLCGAPVGARLVGYRNYHLQHHKFAQQAEDPDLVLSAPFPITRGSLWRKAVRDLTGQTFFKQRTAVLRSLMKSRKADGRSALDVIAFEARRQAPFLWWNAIVLAISIAAGAWWAWPVLWVLPMATWYPLVTRIRNIAEHALVAKDEPDPFRHARTTRANPIERLLVAPYYVNFHCEHHMFMHVPCWNLPAAHKALVRKGLGERMLVEKGYPQVLALAAGKVAVSA